MTATTHSAPAIGHAASDRGRDVAAIYSLLALFVTAVVIAVLIWGLPALVIAALALVPVVFGFFIIIALP